MATLGAVFSRYEPGNPTVYCAEAFRSSVNDLHATVSLRAHIANFNVLVKMFATSTVLSTSSFHSQGPGYGFCVGPLRFYGVYSDRYRGTFVLSHAIRKHGQKLAQQDIDRMTSCLRAFDALVRLP